MKTLTLAIAEDHRIFRKGIILSLQPYKHLSFIAEAGNGKELIEQLDSNGIPDIVLMDIRMPGMDGIEASRYISKHHPMVRIICLTMFEDQQFVDEMLKSGACGYLLKNAEPAEINTAILEVMANGHYNNSTSNGVFSNKDTRHTLP